MNNLYKKLSGLFLILLLSSSIGFAEINLEETTVFLKNINIQIQNQYPTPIQTILHNGAFYVPLNLISKDLNCSVIYDIENNKIHLKNDSFFQDFPEANPWREESFIYGEILKIDKENKILSIEQHFDDHSIYVESNIKASENVVIIMERNDKKMNLDFADLRVGDIVGLVLTHENIARGIILD